MEIISTIGLIASPFLIEWITNGIKKFHAIKFSESKKSILRFIVATLSFGVVILNGSINDTTVDPGLISQFADTAILFLGTQGVYFWKKYRKVQG